MAHTLIPQPSAGSIQGATVQPWYIFPTNQPELRAYALAAHRLRHIVNVTPRTEGATVMRTDPIPPVSNPLFNYYWRDVNRLTEQRTQGRTAQFDGATSQQTYVFPTNQPELNRFELSKQSWRFIVAVTPRYDGATILRTDPIPPVSQPEMRSYANISARLRYIIDVKTQLDQGATKQQKYDFPTNQPELQRYALKDSVRNMPKAVPLFDGFVADSRWFIYPTNQPEMRSYTNLFNAWRYITSAIVQLHQGATKQQKYDFPTNQPDFARYASAHLQRYIVDAPRLYEGATSQPWFIYPTNQPDQVRYMQKHTLRYVVGAFLRFDGRLVFQSYEFPVNQPEMRSYEVIKQSWRYIIQVKPQMEGATKQAWFIYPTNQPDLLRFQGMKEAWRYIVAAPPQLHQGATVQDIEVYFPNQADQAAYALVMQRNRRIVDAKPRFEGATLQPWFIYPTNQPELRRFTDLNRLRHIVGTTPRFDGQAPLSAFGLLIGVGRTTKIGTGTRTQKIGVRRNVHIGLGTAKRIK